MKKIIGLIGVILVFALVCAFATGCNGDKNEPEIPMGSSTSVTTGKTTDKDGSTGSTASTASTAATASTASTTGTKATGASTSTTKGTTGTTVVAAKDLVIFLDPGHGGKPEDDGDGREAGPGAIGYYDFHDANGAAVNRDADGVKETYKEADINLEVALKAKAELEKLGYTVVLSRTEDKFVGLAERTQAAVAVNANMFISIHVNSYNGDAPHGFEAYYHGKSGLKYDGKAFADLFTKEFTEIKDIKNDSGVIAYPNMNIRGTKADTDNTTNGYAVLKETSIPSTLLELGFISNKNDAFMLTSKYWQNYAAKAIAEAVQAAHYAGIYKTYPTK